MNINVEKVTVTVIHKCMVKTKLGIPPCHKQPKRKLKVLQKAMLLQSMRLQKGT